jgi:hypothetical protein
MLPIFRDGNNLLSLLVPEDAFQRSGYLGKSQPPHLREELLLFVVAFDQAVVGNVG